MLSLLMFLFFSSLGFGLLIYKNTAASDIAFGCSQDYGFWNDIEELYVQGR
jgi:hypothetical protein